MSNENEYAAANFTPIKIDEHSCNVNRKPDDIFFLNFFDDAIPRFDPQNGPHLVLNSKKNGESKIFQLNAWATETIMMPNSKKMSDEEYFTEFCKRKTIHVQSLIQQTFSKGFEFPIGVQRLAIPELIQGKDALVQFKSGTGKTQAFTFGMLYGFDINDQTLQYVFVTSTHEVANQIYVHAKSLLPDGAKILLCIGNKKTLDGGKTFGSGNEAPMRGGFKTISTSSFDEPKRNPRQEKEEFCNAQVIVCTIGKFHDYFCNRKWLSEDRYKYMKGICVDEFDRIIKTESRTNSVMSTEKQFEEIIEKIPATSQRVFFSATVTPQSLEIGFTYFRKQAFAGEPFIVLLDTEDYTLEGIKQFYVKASSFQQKADILMDLIKQLRISQAVIFANTTDTVIKIKKLLDSQPLLPTSCEIFHGRMLSEDRKRIMEDFLDNKFRVLISTDVTSRGIDVHRINVVINFDMPEVIETYIHRVGRSGRFGRKGVAISLIHCSDQNKDDEEYLKVIKINEISKSNKMVPLTSDMGGLAGGLGGLL